jgi:hypothetical protein
MRLRRLDANGDATFGQGQGNLWINQPEGVGQLVMTRLRLNQGEWFADLTQGTPWKTEVLGERTAATRDLVVRGQVLDTIGVQDIPSYGSRIDDTRTWSVAMTLDTVFGPVALAATKLPATVPPLPPAAPSGTQIAATGLGIAGGTALTMVPADLTQGPRSDVTDFEIKTLAAGSW